VLINYKNVGYFYLMNDRRKKKKMRFQTLTGNKLLNNSAAIFLGVFILIFSGFVIWLELKIGIVSNLWYSFF